MAALPYQVFHQTGSSFAVGLLGVVQLGPLLLFSLVGGAFADSIDKRRLLIGVTATSFGCSAALAANASLDHPRLWLLYVLGAIVSGVVAVSFPVLRALLPMLLDSELRPAGYALQATYASFGMMAGPALGGVLIGLVGLTSAYTVDAATYVLALGFFAGIAPAPPVAGSRVASTSSVLEGLRFLRGHSVIMSTFGIDLLAMVFGMPRALFPALTDRLGGGPMLYGLLLASVAGGAFVASLVSGWTSRVQRQGRAVLVAVTVWGTAIAIAGLTHVPAVVMTMLAIAGGADMISGVYRSAITADVTPDELRGRVSGVEFAVYAGGPVLGDVEAGVVGGLAGVPFAIVSGGVACVVSAAVFATRVRSFATYRRAPETSPP
jgi:MFS family permease